MKYSSYILLIIIGVIIIIGTFLKLIGILEFSSDWFWFLAGCGLALEGVISLVKQNKFDRKYKIVKRV